MGILVISKSCLQIRVEYIMIYKILIFIYVIVYICLEINTFHIFRIIICIYRPPSIYLLYHIILYSLLSYFCSTVTPIILLVNFSLHTNSTDRSHPSHPQSYTTFVDCITSNSLSSCIAFNTRINIMF